MENQSSQDQTKKIPELGSEAFDLWIDYLKDLVRSGKDQEVLQFLQGIHPVDLTESIQELEPEEAFYIFRLFDPLKQSEILIELDEEFQAAFLEKLQPREISPIFENLESDDITFILRDVEPGKVDEVLKNLNAEDSHLIRAQLEFKENTAGRIMSNDFASVLTTDTVQKSIAKVRKIIKEVDDIYLVYVVDQHGKLMGFLRLKDFLFNTPSTKIHKIMKPTLFSVHYNTDQEDVAHLFRKYDLVSIAVTDDDEKIIGRITVDDVLDIVHEEASEDIYRMGGVSEDEKLTTPVLGSMKKRIVWLILNLGTASITSSVVALFENTIEQVVVLATLMPIVAGMGGNAGTQSITVVVRNLATGELTLGIWWEAVRKELSIGILNGLLLGVLAGVFLYIFKSNLVLSFVIGIAMLANVSTAGLVGSSVPLLLKYFKVDPAIASSIFVTACTDICGFLFFLGLASYFVNYLV
jgi:magnesium transporter